jgi:hypothetical protein
MSIWKWISRLFHPLLVQQYLLLTAVYNNEFLLNRLAPDQRIGLMLLLCMSLFVIPLSVTFFMSPKPRKFAHLEYQDKSARNKSLSVVLILLLLHQLVFELSNGMNFLAVYCNAALLCGLVCLFLQQFFRLSLHAAAAGSIPSFMLFLMPFTGGISYFWLIPAILLSIVIPIARYRLKAHTLSELYAGYLTGFCSIYLIFAMHYGI